MRVGRGVRPRVPRDSELERPARVAVVGRQRARVQVIQLALDLHYLLAALVQPGGELLVPRPSVAKLFENLIEARAEAIAVLEHRGVERAVARAAAVVVIGGDITFGL